MLNQKTHGVIKNGRMSAVFSSAVLLIVILLNSNVYGQNILDKQKMLDRFDFWYIQDWEWYKENIPFLETPDREIDKTYYYRWEIVTVHQVYGSPESGYASTEFISRPWWSGAYGTISCPVGHQIYDMRWLRNSRYVKDYSRFWFRDPGSQLHDYTNWLGDAIWQTYKVNRDFDFATGLLNDLVQDYYRWEDERWVEEEGMFAWNGMRDGMETNINSRQTPGWFDGAPGYRPTLNSYMWAHANAIVNIAELIHDNSTAEEFRRKADRIKSNFQEKNWDPGREFFFHRFRDDEVTADGTDTIRANTLTYETGQHAGSPHGRELHGYIPWYFGMPDPGYESAWQFLMDPEYFYADFGPTTVEQNDPLFHISPHCCQWSGNSWPFATTQTLKAMARLLTDYEQDYVSREDYQDLFRIYALTHRRDGKPFIGEAVHPHTGSWDGHDHVGHSEHYYHSAYVDLVINDLIGLKPQAGDSVVIDPLVPEEWDYFCLDDVMYHGRRLSVLWDRDGSRYNAGAGLQVFVDGVSVASAPEIQRLVASVEYRPQEDCMQKVNYAVNNSDRYYPRAIASFPGIEHPVSKINDGQKWYFTSTTNQWSNIYSEAEKDWCGVDFGDKRIIDEAIIYFVDNGEDIRVPESYLLEYWDGETWMEVKGQKRQYPAAKGNRGNRISFPEVETAKLRILLRTQDGYYVAVSEFETWGTPLLPVSVPEDIQTDNIAFHTGATASASYTSRFDNVSSVINGSINPARRWTAFESPNDEDWVRIDLDSPGKVHTVHLFLYSDGGNVTLPDSFKIQYLENNRWRDVEDVRRIPEETIENALNIISFREVETTGIRVVLRHPPGDSYAGIYEIELYGNNQ